MQSYLLVYMRRDGTPDFVAFQAESVSVAVEHATQLWRAMRSVDIQVGFRKLMHAGTLGEVATDKDTFHQMGLPPPPKNFFLR